MKIFFALLAVTVVLSLFLGLAASEITEMAVLMPNDDHKFINEITHYSSSEPAIMLLIGTCLISIAGIGRKKISDKDTGNGTKERLKPKLVPHPDPVPWKKSD